MELTSYVDKLLVKEGLTLLKKIKGDLMSPKDFVRIDTLLNQIELDNKVEYLKREMKVSV